MQALRLHSIVIMHLLSEPVGGLGGDFEFTIMSAAPDKVVMSGTKTRNMITLTPMPKERTWTSYLEGVLANQDAIFLGTFKLMVNGKEVGSVVQDYNVFTLTYNGADERDPKVEIPFLYTDEGIKLYLSLIHI